MHTHTHTYIRIHIHTYTYIYIINNNNKKQIGKKPRNGAYGACFDPKSNGRQLFAARPGKRLWVADSMTGQVRSTIKYVCVCVCMYVCVCMCVCVCVRVW